MKLIQGDSLNVLKTLIDNSVDLVVTSPPYNKGAWLRNKSKTNGWIREIEYDAFSDDLPPEVYEQQQRDILNELIRVVKPTGSIFYNHIDIFNHHNTIHPKWVYDYALKQIIVWDRGNTPKIDKTYFLPTTEYLFWIKKDKECKPYFNRRLGDHRKNIWRINKANGNPHPAPFPEELVENCILTCSKEGDVVLDPYNGSGTTTSVAHKLNRDYIGIDISKEYTDIAQQRINSSVRQ